MSDGTEPQSICWALLNPKTGKVDHRCYVREESAKAGAAALTNRWNTYLAVPLFLHPAVYEEEK